MSRSLYLQAQVLLVAAVSWSATHAADVMVSSFKESTLQVSGVGLVQPISNASHLLTISVGAMIMGPSNSHDLDLITVSAELARR